MPDPPTAPKRSVRNMRFGLLALVVIAGLGGLVAIISSRTSGHSSGSGQPSGAPTTNGLFDVVHYGADPSGKKDSTAAIRSAIAAAEAPSRSGSPATVYFPSGTYILDDNDGRAADFVINQARVNILGAGSGDTKIVEEVGTNKYSSLKRGKTVFVFGRGMSGFSVSGLTIDCRTYNGGDVLDNYGSHSVIQDSEFLGGYNGTGQVSDNSLDDFDIRDIAICHHTSTGAVYGYQSGNVVRNIVLVGQGVGGNDDLDITCQEDVTITNVTDTGWGMALYSVANATVDNYTYKPWDLTTANTHPELTPQAGCQKFGCNFGYFITTGRGVSISNFTSTGAAGTIVGQGARSNPPNRPSENITITNEQSGASGRLGVQDAVGVRIVGSRIGVLHVQTADVSGLVDQSSSIGSVTCVGQSGSPASLVGVACGSTG